MKRPLAYVTAPWTGDESSDTEMASMYCRVVYDAGYAPICPVLYLPLILDDNIPEEHQSRLDMSRDLVRRAHVLVVCGDETTEDMKHEIAAAERLGVTATTLEGIMAVKQRGRA